LPGVVDALKAPVGQVKVFDLGLIVEDDRKGSSSSSTIIALELPLELPSVVDALKAPAAAEGFG
jgi:hypothetical protein